MKARSEMMTEAHGCTRTTLNSPTPMSERFAAPGPRIITSLPMLILLTSLITPFKLVSNVTTPPGLAASIA